MADPVYKYEEDKILAELKAYVDSTYSAHYVGNDNIQAIDLMAAGGMILHFAASSIIKYAFRFGKKDGYNRKDVLKIIHYAMFILWQLNKEKPTTVGTTGVKLTPEQIASIIPHNTVPKTGGLKPPVGWSKSGHETT